VLAGNEECGQMSAWYLMSSLGFYAVDPVSGNYIFGTPLFDRADVQLENGKTLVVETEFSERPSTGLREFWYVVVN
jgi:putative alpha-1,2-mannosidase